MASELLLAYTAYAVGVISPGPSNMAIMATAMEMGRRQALSLAAGVLCGSLVWGAAAAFGMASLLAVLPSALAILKAIGGCYLFWLAFKAGRTAWTPGSATGARVGGRRARTAFASGAAMHLTNPKAVLVWLSIATVAAPTGGASKHAIELLLGCAAIGAVLFGVYALAFSAPQARCAYAHVQRWLNSGMCIIFAYAGLRVLRS